MHSENNNFRLLQTKLKRPPVTNDFIFRQSIVDKLEKNAFKPFSLISAGAGYGKSVAVSQWLEQTDYSYGWISLDEEHDNLQSFLLYLFEAVNNSFPSKLEETYNVISASVLPPYQLLSRILFNDLCEIEEDLIIVLDDYYKIKNEQIHRLLNDWLKLPPPHIHLVIITRRDPPLNLQTLRLNDRLTEIRMDELSFSIGETNDLFKKISVLEIPEDIQQKVHEKTEGWVIAIRLVSLVAKGPLDLEKVISRGEYSSGFDTISDYLVSEVLPALPENIRNNLLTTSFLPRFSSELINEVSSPAINEEGLFSGEEFIKWLKHENMFIIPLDSQGKWFRYHHLFQDILKVQSQHVLDEQNKRNIHLNASFWFEKNELLEESMYHALAAESQERAVEIVKKHRLPLINGGKWSQLDKLFKRISKEIIENDIELLIIEAYLGFCYADHIGVGETVGKMQPIVKKDIKKISTELIGEYHFYVGYTTIYLKQDPIESLRNMEMALNEVPESSSEPRALLELFYALFSQIAGSYSKAKPWLEELLGASSDFAPIRKNRLILSMFLICTSEGDLKKVKDFRDIGIKSIRSTSQKDTLGSCLMIVGHFFIRQGRWKEAIPCYEEVLSIKYHVHTRSVVDSYIGLILANFFLHNQEQNKALIKEFEQYAGELGEHHRKFVWSMKTRYALIHDDNQTIRESITTYNQDFLHLVFWLDVPEITYIRALLYSGSDNQLEMTIKNLESLIMAAESRNNRIHLLELYALESVYYKKTNDLSNAMSSILKSLEISAEQDIKGFYIELFDELDGVLDLVSENQKFSAFIDEIKFLKEKVKSEIQNNNKRLLQNTDDISKKVHLDLFTPKELEILHCVAEGLRNKEIADRLGNSEETIKKHMYNMFQKIHAKNRLNLVSKAKEIGILV